jgi:hypothetical protein
MSSFLDKNIAEKNEELLELFRIFSKWLPVNNRSKLKTPRKGLHTSITPGLGKKYLILKPKIKKREMNTNFCEL